MDAIKALAEAAEKAKAILAELVSNDWEVIERDRMSAMSKEELIEELILMKAKSKQQVTVQECVVRILEDETCDFLSYEMIAALVNRARPGTATNPKCVAWYFSQENSKRDGEARPVRLRRKLQL